LSYDPQNVDILALLGDIHSKMEQRNAAIEAYTQAGKIIKETDAGKAIYFFEKVHKYNTEDIETLSALAELYTRQKLQKKALDLHLEVGKKLFEKGDYDRCHLHLYEYIQHEPDNREVNMMILKTLMRMKNFEDALIHLNSICKSDSATDKELLQYRTDLLFVLGRTEELKGLMNKLVMLMDDDYSTLFKYIERAMERENFDLAVELMNHLDLSQYYGFGDRLNSTLNRILAECENHLPAMKKLVEFKVYAGDIPAAIFLYSRLYKLYLENDNLQKAYQLLEKWLTIEEENEWIRREQRRVKLLIEDQSQSKKDVIRGKFEEIGLADVIQMLESAKKTGALNVSYADRRGNIYFQKGNIMHASFQGVEGRTAIVDLFKLKGGDFIFAPDIPEGVSRTIDGSNTQIVLESLRLIDEEKNPDK